MHLIAEKEALPKRQDQTFLGIDRGIKNIVVTSDNKFYNSKKLKKIKGRYQYLKAVLQSKGTKSAKRKLKKLFGRERRFVRDLNHYISKEFALKDYAYLCVEDLHISKEKGLGKKFNKKLGNWSYTELLKFLAYKLEEQGKNLILVNPNYTSQRCSVCRYIKKRNRQASRFKCKNCGFELNADLNAARNIAYFGKSEVSRLSVIQPNAAGSA